VVERLKVIPRQSLKKSVSLYHAEQPDVRNQNRNLKKNLSILMLMPIPTLMLIRNLSPNPNALVNVYRQRSDEHPFVRRLNRRQDSLAERDRLTQNRSPTRRIRNIRKTSLLMSLLRGRFGEMWYRQDLRPVRHLPQAVR
jgi:hypothetical protein